MSQDNVVEPLEPSGEQPAPSILDRVLNREEVPAEEPIVDNITRPGADKCFNPGCGGTFKDGVCDKCQLNLKDLV